MKTLDELLSELRQRDVKLWLEGDRLRYRAAKDSLTPELLTELKTQKAEIINFLRQITTAASSQIPPIVVCERNGNLPLSFGQQRIWFLHQFEPNSSSNNMPVVVRFTGNLNVAFLEESLREVVRRHEVLRTTFPAVNGKPTQVIATDVSLTLPIIDLRQIPDEKREAEALLLATKEAHQPFDLANGPILRLLLLRLSDREHLLIWNMHCIVCDGASSDIFYQDFTTIYKALSAGNVSPLTPLPVQYADFTNWQYQWLQGEVLESQVNYWKQKLEGNLPIIELPYDHLRPHGVQTYRGDRAALLLSKTLNHALTDLSQKWGVTLFMTLLTVFELLLYRYSGQEDLLISFASASRGQVETERLIGFFSNTLVMRGNLAGNPTFRQLLDRVRKDCLEAYSHQDLPFERLIEELRPEQQSRNSSSLFQVKFSLNPPWSNGRGMGALQLPDLTITSLFGYIYHGKTKYDLTLVLREQDNGLGMVFDYNAEMFDASTIERMLGHFKTLLEGIVANADQPISELPLLTAPEQHQLLVDWNGKQADYPQNTCIHQWFEAQAKRTPDNIAVSFENQQLTYQELNQRANQLADYLQTLGVKSGVLVGLYVEPSLEMIVGLLGILKAGGTYVSIAPTSGQDSLSFILKDAQISLLLTQSSLVEKFSEHQVKVICVDNDWEAIALHTTENQDYYTTDQTLACVIYVSGSNGKPNGIAITHRSLVTHSLAISDTWELTQSDRLLLLPSITCNSFIESLFPTWIAGATVILQSQELQSTAQFFPFIAQQQITVVNLPTYFWHQLIKEPSLSPQTLPVSLRLMMVGGEKVSRNAYLAWVEKVGKQVRWLNGYGSLETTLTATVYDPATATEASNTRSEIPIGKAIANTQIYILDRRLQPLPIGVTGEIYISGIGIVQGYFNRPELTSEKFIPNPFSSESESYLYRSGDFGRYLSDGNIEFIGRRDNQAKIRGFRIELTEIETILDQYPGVQNAVVIAREDVSGDKYLVAYLVPKQDETIGSEQLLSFLQQKLPEHLLPTFVIVDSLPLNANGQVDRQALLALNPANAEREKIFATAENPLQLQLTEIWENVLGIHPIGITDNFFDLGGHSLLAVRLFSQIEKIVGKNLALSILLQAPTIEQLANIVEREICSKPGIAAVLTVDVKSETSIPWSSLVAIQPNGSKPPFFCVHGLGGEVLRFRELAVHLGSDQPFYGLQPQGLDGKQLPYTRIEDMAAHYIQQIQTIQPREPYLIGGYSSGGLIAYEMARQLTIQGKEVALLVLFDTYGSKNTESISLQKPASRDWNSLLAIASNYLIEQVKGNTERFKYQIKEILWRFVFHFHLILGRPLPYSNRKFMVEHATIQALRKYALQVYSGKATVFRTEDGLVVGQREADSKMGWGKLALGGVDIYDISGIHNSIFKEPHVRSVSEKMKSCIDQIIAESNSVK
ncbi:amino acid adenylation domain-containing protein [Nostoc sp. UCD121]|uniref:non-ribosomal peptide synthetase n=1 Tax=unclassified Nostoc TaxID=2593658 RepID=UPI0016289F6D|nr:MULTISPECIES: non-ribosomal peptide synthetase [unclassified Nostoc]MBC1219356.1 amino acid adenylation domain-containing protein [Nostoc sp. UCD120]MBC1279727.1 amino acid adenylation domain-containing protein [Nostoc sp. UCD121]MBC1297802.1 amino acid adenylation domain-containing protein [Nostoc sp. UCD122]